MGDWVFIALVGAAVVHIFEEYVYPGGFAEARRHIEALHELTTPEAVELGVLIRQVSVALRDVTGCLKTYVIQFAEAAKHPHVHFHIVPRMADQPEEYRSTKVFAYLGVPEAERVGEERMNEITARIRQLLQSPMQ